MMDCKPGSGGYELSQEVSFIAPSSDRPCSDVKGRNNGKLMCSSDQTQLLVICCLLVLVMQDSSIERFHVTSQSRENHTGGHFGVQLNGDLVCCMVRMQNAVRT